MDDFTKKQTNLENRKIQARRVLRKYEGYVPVHVQKSAKSRIPNVIRSNYIVASDVTVGIFIFNLRKEISLKPEEGLFIFIDNCIPSNTTSIGDLYNAYKKEDLHLHLTYSNENVYG